MTNREIAKALEISPATLSLIINNKPGISEATRSRVLKRIDEMGLSHIIKSHPVPSTDNNICFVVYKRHGEILDVHSFFLLLIESIEACARKHGYDMLFLSIDRRNTVEEQIQRLNSMNCKGAIIFATEMLEDDITYFKSLQMPYIVLDNDFPILNLDSVAINNTLGTYQAVEYLVKMGHRKIGYLQSSVFINSFAERENGFRQALRHFGLDLNPKYVFKLNYTEEGSYQDLRKLLNLNLEMPTAFFSDDDTIVAGAIKAMAEFGISVPDDISVIGFNDRPVYAKSKPALTSIQVPKYAFGAMAVDLLVKRIESDSMIDEGIHSYKYRIGTELVIRDSVRAISD